MLTLTGMISAYACGCNATNAQRGGAAAGGADPRVAAPGGAAPGGAAPAPGTSPAGGAGVAGGAPRGRDDGLGAARRLFYAAVDGDARALRQCAEALRGRGGDPVKVLAYRGGCRMLEAARAPLPWDQGRLAREGLNMLDDAVKRAPDDPEVRFLRGMTSYHLPQFFGRREVAAADLAAVARDAEAAVRSGRVDVAIGAAALFHYGDLLDRRRDRPAAHDAWRRAAALGPGTPAGRAADRKLNGRTGG